MASALWLLSGAAGAADRPFAGMTLTLASSGDPFGAVLVDLAPSFTAATGITVKVQLMGYPELLTRASADFIGHTRGFDLVTMDNVWAGQFAEGGFTVDLTDRIRRDAAEIGVDDIYPVLMQSLGSYKGRQIAFPFAGYANILVYRTDLFAAAGLAAPRSMEEVVADAFRLTKPPGQYGFVANGQRGPAVAQDWMQFNAEMGGAILDAAGRPALNSAANVKSLMLYRQLFDKAAPPGAAGYDWSGREEAFRQGLAAEMQTWSVGAAVYDDPAQSKVGGRIAIIATPPGNGQPERYGVGGWGMAINADIDERRKEAAWLWIKWLTSPAVHKDFVLRGSGSYLRISETHDADIRARFPFVSVIDKVFAHGDGEYRPRIPQYPEIQDLLGDAVNDVLVGNADPGKALDAAEAEARKLF
jgi:multiple sugar transport system substrate-binding protein